MKHIDISKDFSRHPAGRYVDDGPYSGEEFRTKFLEEPLRRHEVVEVKLDGVRGYGSSFLEEAFGGLVRAGLSVEEILKNLTLISSNRILIKQILSYIQDGLRRNERVNAVRTTHPS